MAKKSLVHVLWRNILVRTALYYVVTGGLFYWFPNYLAGDLPVQDFSSLLSPKSAAERDVVRPSGAAALPTAIAMLAAVAFALPVSWIYTLTRRKKGWKQGVVQRIVVLPVIIAGIVVLLK